MGVRDKLRGPVGVGVAGAVLAVAAVIVLTQEPERSLRPKVAGYFYYDVESKETFPSKEQAALPPVDAPSGAGNGVRAYVFSCTDCSDASTRFTGYLVKYSDEFKEKRDKPSLSPEEAATLDREGKLVRAVDDEDWVPAFGEDSQRVYDVVKQKCPGTQADECLPTAEDFGE